MIEPDQRDGRRGTDAGSRETRAHNLALRVASAAVLGPAVLALTYLGGWPFLALCFLGALGILYEWTLLTAGGPEPRILIPGAIGLLAAALFVGAALPNVALGVTVVSAVVAALIAFTTRGDGARLQAASWAAGGVVYAAAALLGPALLRHDPQWGLSALLFLFATVWATDIFAYFAGRGFGGPLLAPRVSPKKTWAGAAGGLAGGVVAGVLVAYASAGTQPVAAGVLAVILSIAAQGGDLLESSVKRRFGAKDTSALIPGHGGVMDRVDGLLVAALIAVAIGALRFGAAASARGLLLW